MNSIRFSSFLKTIVCASCPVFLLLACSSENPESAAQSDSTAPTSEEPFDRSKLVIPSEGGNPHVFLSPESPIDATVGDQFTVSVKVDPKDAFLSMVGVGFDYDPEIIRFVRGTIDHDRWQDESANLDPMFPPPGFLDGAPAFQPSEGSTADGTLTDLDVQHGAWPETWTIKCVEAGPPSEWSVVGSMTGDLSPAMAVAGAPFEGGYISFQINEGATPFSVGDSFQFRIARKETDLLLIAAATNAVYRPGAVLVGEITFEAIGEGETTISFKPPSYAKAPTQTFDYKYNEIKEQTIGPPLKISVSAAGTE